MHKDRYPASFDGMRRRIARHCTSHRYACTTDGDFSTADGYARNRSDADQHAHTANRDTNSHPTDGNPYTRHQHAGFPSFAVGNDPHPGRRVHYGQ